MSDREALAVVHDAGMATSLNVPTWRYAGDRDAADLAYCARFGVTEAPEPTIALGGALAYAVPSLDRQP